MNVDCDIAQKVDTHRKSEILKNRKILRKILETVVWLGKQGLAFRGHRDSGHLLQDVSESNQGNFRELLRFRILSGDTELEEHFNSCPSNAMYTSPVIQNDLIMLCGEFIQAKIVEKVKSAKFFSILVDETTDVSTAQQMVLCVRYFDGEVEPNKRRLLRLC